MSGENTPHFGSQESYDKLYEEVKKLNIHQQDQLALLAAYRLIQGQQRRRENIRRERDNLMNHLKETLAKAMTHKMLQHRHRFKLSVSKGGWVTIT